ncbi:MAG TPA: DNA translocase FtsK 4TM domain-containing protein, partial [candidate division Zixibacteria bacterium]|nr:DNA translocase FtsK 4TM domain-containing protein [candidate division Zixibacteria bacterium]
LLSHSVIDDRQILEGSVDILSLKSSSQLVTNRGGVVGAYLSLALFFFLGWGAILTPLWLFIGGAWLWKSNALRRVLRPAAYYTAAALALFTLIDNFGIFSTLAATGDRSAAEIVSSAGGLFSLKINYLALRYLGGIGSLLALLALNVTLLLYGLPRTVKLESVPAPLKTGGRLAGGALGGAYTGFSGLFKRWRDRRNERRVRDAERFVSAETETDEVFESRLRDALSSGRRRDTADSFEAEPTVAPFLEPPAPQMETAAARSRRSSQPSAVSEETAEQTSLDLHPYEFPGLELLADPPVNSNNGSREEMAATAADLRDTLSTFGVRINGEITAFPGPVVSRFEFRPAQGVKVNQILNLADDLALALRAKRIRIVAPIPGKAAVGIEIPVRKREVVYLKDALKSPRFASPDVLLPLALGKNIAGEPFVADLTKMPHLLIAGATGSGKSVCINVIITSLLYRMDPSELRFIFIDPKMLELSVYAGIPHLERPVVTNPRKAERVLADAVVEMEERYKKLAMQGVRSIADYNAKMTDPSKKLPYLVIMIDELADLMMTQSSAKTELLLTRLAQMARAVGIHLILATQRPSVDVITGLIKANFPSRIAFHVASKTDSRTILDGNGAEKLLGQGDMLLQWAGQPEMIRLHGAFISGEETENIVNKIKSQRVEVERIENVAREIPDEELEDKPKGSADTDDPLYLSAVEVVLHHKQASVSLLQRRLGIGYQRAARLVDKMEETGIVGPLDGSKGRRVLVDASYLEELGGGAEAEERQLTG